jgi:hypothetical protein
VVVYLLNFVFLLTHGKLIFFDFPRIKNYFYFKSLTKDDLKRPKYKDLLKYPFVVEQMQENYEINEYVTRVIDKMNGI